jgi:hypothetical protein
MPPTRPIPLGLVAQVAALAMLTGCGDDHRVEAQRCLDIADWQVVPDDRCERPSDSGARVGAGRYFWHYGGRGYNVGDRPTGGSPIPSSTFKQVRVNSPASGHLGGPSSRGGFGSSAAHASGGS